MPDPSPSPSPSPGPSPSPSPGQTPIGDGSGFTSPLRAAILGLLGVAIIGNIAGNAALADTSQVFNVTTFGAKGDGVTDDTAAIQAAINACKAAGRGTVLFPSGTYYLNSYAPGHNTGSPRYSLTFGDATSATIVLSGYGAVLTSPLNVNDVNVTYYIFNLSGTLVDCVFEGLTFVHTHGITAGQTRAITAYAGNPSVETIQGLKIKDCTFRNFANDIYLSGCQSPQVIRCRFLSDNGRDSATTTTVPAVGIWCHTDQSGTVSDVLIDGNYFDGCLAASVAGNSNIGHDNRVGRDGFVFHTARGWRIVNNHIKHHGYEAIYLLPRDGALTDASIYPSVVANNTIESALVSGTSSANNNNYSIRCDESSVVIDGNHITGASDAVMVAKYDSYYATFNGKAGVTITDQVYSNNQIQMSGVSGNTGLGFNLNGLSRGKVVGNKITWPSYGTATWYGYSAGFYVNSCHKIDFVGNTVETLVKSGGAYPLYGFFFDTGSSACDDITLVYNITDNLDNGINLNSGTNGAPTVWLSGHNYRNSTSQIVGTLTNLHSTAHSSGTATITSTATMVVVNHGLPYAPLLQNITVTPTNSMGKAAKFWISSVNASSFTINVDAAPGATPAAFAWTATLQ